MKLGVHPFIWTDEWNDKNLDLINRVSESGFDFIEIPLTKLEVVTPEKIRKRLEQTKLGCCASTLLTAETDISSPNKGTRKKGINRLKTCVEMVSEMGGKLLCGAIYCSFGKKGTRPPTELEYKYSADALREVAEFSKKYDIMIGLEPLNRYENYFINTVEQVKNFINLINKPNIQVQLDTYHMHIEEKSQYLAIKSAGDLLCHIHLCENDRGIPGTGQCYWDDIFKALGEIHFQGSSAIEGFFGHIPSIAAATCVWRELAPSPEILVKEGLEFIKTKAKQYSLI